MRRGVAAARVTAVIPISHARQDRRTRTAESVGVRVVADLLGAVHIDRVLVVDPQPQPSTCSQCRSDPSAPCRCSLRARPLAPADAIVVAPDLGAVKLAERYASALDLPVVVIRKTRLSGTSVLEEVVGNVEGRAPIVIDDMISTAGTIVTATDSLIRRGCQPSVLVAATHALLVGPAIERLRALPLRRLVVTNSLPAPEHLAFPHEVADITDLVCGRDGPAPQWGTATRHRP